MSLRNRTIRLAHSMPELRPHLLRVLQATEGDKEAEEVEARFTEGPEGEKEFAAWLKKQPKSVQDDWNKNKDKYKDKFKGASERLFMAAAVKHYAGCEKLPEGPMRDNCEKKKEEGGKKEAALRAATIRLARENPALRPHLLPLLQG